MTSIAVTPAKPPALSEADQEALTDLYVRGTPKNTLRAYERDLLYITAWKVARFKADLLWPEAEEVALTFILDHSRSLQNENTESGALIASQALISQGLRKTLACPAPSTLDRRIASWQAFHRMKNLDSPFDAPALRQARSKSRKATARRSVKKSQNPITRDVLEDLLEACDHSLRGVRDRAILMLGWASGGRRRSEITNLKLEDVDLKDYAEKQLIWLHMVESKTTPKGETPALVLKGRAAKALKLWIDLSEITDGPLFRPVSKADRALARKLSPDGVYQILKNRLKRAGYSEGFASPHGLRSGFLTQAALDGAPIQAAMRLSLHRSMAQAQRYYDDVDIAENPAAELLEK